MNRPLPINSTKQAGGGSRALRAAGGAIALWAGWAATARPCAAHVKWFLKTSERSGLAHAAGPDLFVRWTPVNIGLLVLTIGVLAILWIVSARVSGHPRLAALNRRLEPLHPWCPTLVGGLTGLMLLMNAFDGTYVALDLRLHEANAHWAAFPEALVGLALLLGWGTRFAALALLVLFALAFGLFPARTPLTSSSFRASRSICWPWAAVVWPSTTVGPRICLPSIGWPRAWLPSLTPSCGSLRASRCWSWPWTRSCSTPNTL